MIVLDPWSLHSPQSHDPPKCIHAHTNYKSPSQSIEHGTCILCAKGKSKLSVLLISTSPWFNTVVTLCTTNLPLNHRSLKSKVHVTSQIKPTLIFNVYSHESESKHPLYLEEDSTGPLGDQTLRWYARSYRVKYALLHLMVIADQMHMHMPR